MWEQRNDRKREKGWKVFLVMPNDGFLNSFVQYFKTEVNEEVFACEHLFQV